MKTEISDESGDTERKRFFLDTSALMRNSLTIFSLASCPVPKEILQDEKTKFYTLVEELGYEIKEGKPNDIYISTMVEWELDNIKDNDRKDPIQRSAARNALNVLTQIRDYGAKKGESMHKGITLPNGSSIYLIDHNEKKFLEEKIELYEPNRDDRIIYDYINFINNVLLKNINEKSKSAPHQHNKNSQKDKLIPVELVTEDYHFRGKVIDEFSRSDIKAKCNPLLSERTESPNPGKRYVGVYPEPLRIHNKKYEELLNSAEYVISFQELVNISLNGKAINQEKIAAMYPNQFIKIIPEDPSEFAEEISTDYYLKKLESGFSIMKNYNEFMKREYKDGFENISIDAGVMDIRNPEVVRQMIGETSLTNRQKKVLRNKTSKQNIESVLKEIVPLLKPVNFDKYISKDQSLVSNAFSSNILRRNIHPEILPIDEQKPFLELLTDPSIGLVTFVAPQGAGKTYFSLAAGYSLVKQKKYERIVYLRPMVTTGESIGFLPGSEEKKTAPFMQSCYDSVDKLLCMAESEEFYLEYPQMRPPKEYNVISELKSQKILETEIITYIAGRTINNSFIIFDEAQLLNREQMRMMIGRIGDTSKLVLIGDFAQLAAANAESRRKYDLITPESAGLSHVIESLNGPKGRKCPFRPIYGHLSINREFSKRSQVAAIAGYI